VISANPDGSTVILMWAVPQDAHYLPIKPLASYFFKLLLAALLARVSFCLHVNKFKGIETLFFVMNFN
jgi:hypothetical protein